MFCGTGGSPEIFAGNALTRRNLCEQPLIYPVNPEFSGTGNSGGMIWRLYNQVSFHRTFLYLEIDKKETAVSLYRSVLPDSRTSPGAIEFLIYNVV